MRVGARNPPVYLPVACEGWDTDLIYINFTSADCARLVAQLHDPLSDVCVPLTDSAVWADLLRRSSQLPQQTASAPTPTTVPRAIHDADQTRRPVAQGHTVQNSHLATAALIAATFGRHGLPWSPPRAKAAERPCVVCGKPHMHNNAFCSATCCALHRQRKARQ